LRHILNECFEEVETEMSIKMTFIAEEIAEIQEVTGLAIEEKEDLYNAVRTIIDAVTSMRKGGK
jgi:ribosomal protein S7